MFIIDMSDGIFSEGVLKMLQGLVLGLSNGAVCIGSCAPFILPYMLSGGKTVKSNFSDLFIFLTGRFSGYLGFATVALFTRKIIFRDPIYRRSIDGGLFSAPQSGPYLV